MQIDQKVYYYFKIFNSIKSEHEAKDFAFLELKSLFGDVKPVQNFYDFLSKNPLKLFTSNKTRIQDIFTHELPYGKIQGYIGEKDELFDISNLVKRLAYTREIYIIVNSSEKPETLLKKIFPEGMVEKNTQYFIEDDFILFRFITNQYFLEKSYYISKLSRNATEIDKNIDILFNHQFKGIYRIPASVTLSVGKRLRDYFTIREEPSLYLNHYMHPYKGKFHPKMVRALINYVYPENNGNLLDNFAGSGTLLVEANYLGLNGFGLEINPLSALMCNVKCQSLTIPVDKLNASVKRYMELFEKEANFQETMHKGQKLLIESKFTDDFIKKEIDLLKPQLEKVNGLNKEEKILTEIIIARELLQEFKDDKIREFLQLSLSGAISDHLRRRKAKLSEILMERLNDLYRRIYLFHKLNEVLKINIGEAKCFIDDTRDMKTIKSDSLDGIINSPPYSTALDYIKNDYPQLVLLKLVESMEELDKNMMGNPRKNYDKKELLEMYKNDDKNPLKDTVEAMKYVKILMENDREDSGYRTFKFFIDMYETLKQMYRVMKKDSKCAIVIGNNFYKINDEYMAFPNDEVILELGKMIGFKEDQFIERELQKSSVGNIRKETVVIMKK